MRESLICDTPEKIEVYHLLSLKAMLSIEVKTGLRNSRGSPAGSIRKILNSKTRQKEKLLSEYVQYLTDRCILFPKGVTNG